MFYWFLKGVLLGPLLRLIFRPWVEGLEHVPENGPAILASNHLSFSDSVFLPLVVGRKVVFPAKSEYFTGTGLRGRLTARFMREIGQVPIDRSGGKASLPALAAAEKILGAGELFGYYPEGTRSPDGKLYRGKTGVARLALETGAPVLPVAMIDTNRIQPPGQVVPKIGRIGVRIGPPMDFSRYEGMARDRYILRSVTDEIMYRILELSDQEYVDVYADRRKREIADAKKAVADHKKQADKNASSEAMPAHSEADTALATGPALTTGATVRLQEDPSLYEETLVEEPLRGETS